MAFDINKNKPKVASRTKAALEALNTTEAQAMDNPANELVEMPLSNLVPHPENDKIYSVDNIDQLAEEINEVGLLVPILARKLSDGEYQIISGHRRYYACRKINYEPVKVIVMQDISDILAERLLIATNSYRIKTALEQAKEIEKLQQYYKKMAQEMPERFKNSAITEIARDLNISESQVMRTARLNKLVPELQALIETERLSASEAEKFAGMDEESQRTLCKLLEEKTESISREEADRIRQEYKTSQEQIKAKDAELIKIKKQIEKEEKKKPTDKNTVDTAVKEDKKAQELQAKLDEKNAELERLKAEQAKKIQEIAKPEVIEKTIDLNADYIISAIKNSLFKIEADIKLVSTISLSEEQKKTIDNIMEKLKAL